MSRPSDPDSPATLEWRGEQTLTVQGLGGPVRIRFQGASAPQALEGARRAWTPHVLDGAEADQEVTVFVETPDRVPMALETLSSRVTLSGIEVLSTDHVLLHAAGLADPATGSVLACVAASGTGKTTVSRNAAGRLQYVSDETVAITPTGGIVPYPKPLSIKHPPDAHAPAYRPKEQVPAVTLGLELAPPRGLHLGGVVLLRRILEPRGDEPVELVDLDLFDAILRIVPEVSYLSRLTTPLRRLAEMILRTGGARELVYSDAGSAVDILVSHHPGLSSPAREWDAPPPGLIVDSDEEVALWGRVLPMIDPGVRQGPVFETSEPVHDTLVDPDSARVLMLLGDTLTQVSPITAAILFAAQAPIGAPGLERFVVELFGHPPSGQEVLGGVIDELLERGLLTKVAPRR